MAEFYSDLITVMICYILFWSTIFALILYIKLKHKRIVERIHKLKRNQLSDKIEEK